jgi:hypothetical protein
VEWCTRSGAGGPLGGPLGGPPGGPVQEGHYTPASVGCSRLAVQAVVQAASAALPSPVCTRAQSVFYIRRRVLCAMMHVSCVMCALVEWSNLHVSHRTTREPGVRVYRTRARCTARSWHRALVVPHARGTARSWYRALVVPRARGTARSWYRTLVVPHARGTARSWYRTLAPRGSASRAPGRPHRRLV